MDVGSKEKVVICPLKNSSVEIVTDGMRIMELIYHPVKMEKHTSKGAVPPIANQAVRELDEYFSGKRKHFTLPLKLCGSDFQLEVWTQLRKIPYGAVRTYGDIAKALGKPQAVRAVGQAVGKNPVQIIIPCHRVVGKDGSMTGYSADGGIEVKKKLLCIEQSRCCNQS